jgi:hypothetical protein
MPKFDDQNGQTEIEALAGLSARNRLKARLLRIITGFDVKFYQGGTTSQRCSDVLVDSAIEWWKWRVQPTGSFEVSEQVEGSVFLHTLLSCQAD